MVTQVGHGGSMAVGHFINRLAAASATLTLVIPSLSLSARFFRPV
jgi:hypothetical protein